MELKQYWQCRVLIGIGLGLIVGAAVAAEVPLVPAAAVLVGMVIMYLCRRNLKDVLVDERIERVSEKSSKLVFNAYLIIAGLSAIIIISGGESLIAYRDIAYFLSYSVCALLLAYLAAYGYYQKQTQ